MIAEITTLKDKIELLEDEKNERKKTSGNVRDLNSHRQRNSKSNDQ
jgi:hypothetical protein